MTKTIAVVNAAADTFVTWISKTNQAINAISQECITANNLANGATTTGNAFLTGTFGATIIAANTIRGGNVQSSQVMNVASNVNLSGAVTNVVSNIHFIGANNFFAGVINSTSNVFHMANSTHSILTITTNSTVKAVIANSNTVGVQGNLTVTNAAIFSNTVVIVGQTNVSANLNVTGGTNNLNVAGQVFVAGNLTVTGTIVGGASAAGDTIPAANGQLLGNTTKRWTLSAIDVNISNNLVVSNNITVTANVSTNTVNLNGIGTLQTNTVTTTGTSQQVVDSWAFVTWRSAKYIVSVRDNNANQYQAAELLVIHNSNTTVNGAVFSTEYAQIYSNGIIGAFTADSLAAGTIRLLFTPVSTNTTVKIIRELVAV